ncbi:MAG: hypothetical protein KME21_12955 [Desmonostoc vinosum HA7617-LM4]|jgi:hypothetical protein|nr:hypothetical protein [Desmonostoc vinosum HA7617-LM4]
MVKYKLLLTLKDSGERLEHDFNLNQNHENNPDLFFTYEVCQELRTQLQNRSQRRINDTNLNYLVKVWIQDIKQGYRDTVISLNLPLLSGANIEDLSEAGNQNLPTLITPNLLNIEPQGGALPSLIF